jgi:uncharacterized protein (TIGR00255 family)
MALMSMTGFGSAPMAIGEAAWRIEIRSVNHKSLTVRTSWPSEFSAAESAVVRLVRDRLGRGAVDVAVQAERAAEDTFDVRVDRAAVSALMQELRLVAAEVGAPPPALDAVLRLGPFVEVRRRPVDPTALLAPLEESVGLALDGLVAMRLAEGAALEADLLARLGTLDAFVEAVAEAAPEVLRGFEERLRARLDEASARLGADLDKDRALAEVVVFADKSDMTEELVRARTHLAAFREIIADPAPAEKGRRLDFMTQEILREINTMGSKCRDAAIAQRVVEAKVELEKIREQVQNIA